MLGAPGGLGVLEPVARRQWSGRSGGGAVDCAGAMDTLLRSTVVPALLLLVLHPTTQESSPQGGKVKFGARVEQAKSLCSGGSAAKCRFGFRFTEESGRERTVIFVPPKEEDEEDEEEVKGRGRTLHTSHFTLRPPIEVEEMVKDDGRSEEVEVRGGGGRPRFDPRRRQRKNRVSGQREGSGGGAVVRNQSQAVTTTQRPTTTATPTTATPTTTRPTATRPTATRPTSFLVPVRPTDNEPTILPVTITIGGQTIVIPNFALAPVRSSPRRRPRPSRPPAPSRPSPPPPTMRPPPRFNPANPPNQPSGRPTRPTRRPRPKPTGTQRTQARTKRPTTTFATTLPSFEELASTVGLRKQTRLSTSTNRPRTSTNRPRKRGRGKGRRQKGQGRRKQPKQQAKDREVEERSEEKEELVEGSCPTSLEACVTACVPLEDVYLYSACVVACGKRCNSDN